MGCLGGHRLSQGEELPQPAYLQQGGQRGGRGKGGEEHDTYPGSWGVTFPLDGDCSTATLQPGPYVC